MGHASLANFAMWDLFASWIYFWVVFGLMYLAVVQRRRRTGADNGTRNVNHSARLGVLFEAMAVFAVFFLRRPVQASSDWALVAGILLLPVGVVLMHVALRTLGAHWRLQAVVTDRHELVQNGPYSFLRHPVYAALFAMTIGTGLIQSTWTGLAAGAVCYIIGTEIRVRAEDSLLEARFGGSFADYRSRVAAYIPFVR